MSRSPHQPLCAGAAATGAGSGSYWWKHQRPYSRYTAPSPPAGRSETPPGLPRLSCCRGVSFRRDSCAGPAPALEQAAPRARHIPGGSVPKAAPRTMQRYCPGCRHRQKRAATGSARCAATIPVAVRFCCATHPRPEGSETNAREKAGAPRCTWRRRTGRGPPASPRSGEATHRSCSSLSHCVPQGACWREA